MGSCLSLQGSVPTVKLVVEGAGLVELMEAVKVEDILRNKRLFFVCDARSIEMNHYLEALRLHDRLELDYLYFVFRIEKMKHRLTALDLIALAGYAATAMKQSAHKHSRKVAHLEEECMNGYAFYEILSEELSSGKNSAESSSISSDSTSVGKTRRTMLSPIAEAPLSQSFEHD